MYRRAGFTLIELLIVLGILGFVGAAGFEMLSSSLRLQTSVGTSANHIESLTRAVNLFESDVEQFIPRPVRDGLGEQQPALLVNDTEVLLTRSGWSNPLGEARSTLQRVEYIATESGLERHFWRVLDRDQDSKPIIQTLYSIKSFNVEVLTASGWVSNWPLEVNALPSADETVLEPLALRVTFHTASFGDISRLFELPGATFRTFSGDVL